ncbi:MAG: putative toxin-antitoxin system toxin component, PIN family [Ottowia sp.]|nr:putative toxin-antitoxin system toxin component, PIN family [Ottowia sp.]
MPPLPLIFAVIDTNVLVSALLKPGSVPYKIIAATYSGTIVPIITTAIWKEYVQVLSRKKFSFSAGASTLLAHFADISARCTLSDVDVSGVRDPKDVAFFAAVATARDCGIPAFLVTGNMADFPPADFVVSPRTMLDFLERR